MQEWRRMMRGHCPRPVSAVHDAATWKERAKWASEMASRGLLARSTFAGISSDSLMGDQIERSPCAGAGAVASSSGEEFIAPCCSHSSLTRIRSWRRLSKRHCFLFVLIYYYKWPTGRVPSPACATTAAALSLSLVAAATSIIVSQQGTILSFLFFPLIMFI